MSDLATLDAAALPFLTLTEARKAAKAAGLTLPKVAKVTTACVRCGGRGWYPTPEHGACFRCGGATVDPSRTDSRCIVTDPALVAVLRAASDAGRAAAQAKAEAAAIAAESWIVADHAAAFAALSVLTPADLSDLGEAIRAARKAGTAAPIVAGGCAAVAVEDLLQRLGMIALTVDREYLRVWEACRALPYADAASLRAALERFHPGHLYAAAHDSRNLAQALAALAPTLAKFRALRAERKAAADALTAAGVRCPTGRVEIVGTIATARETVGQWGAVVKCLIVTEAGWKVWGTLPGGCAPGDRVRFTATVEPKAEDPLFGFYSRPAKVSIIAGP